MPQYSQENHLWLDCLFNKVADLQTSNFIKNGSNTVNVASFLGTAFSIEHLRWLLLCILEKEEKKCVEQRRGKIFQMKEENYNI